MNDTEWFQGRQVNERPTVLPLWMWVIGAFILWLLVGCSKPEVPLCERYKGRLVYSPEGEVHVAIDMKNVEILAKVLKGLQEGTCRIEFHKPVAGKEA